MWALKGLHMGLPYASSGVYVKTQIRHGAWEFGLSTMSCAGQRSLCEGCSSLIRRCTESLMPAEAFCCAVSGCGEQTRSICNATPSPYRRRLNEYQYSTIHLENVYLGLHIGCYCPLREDLHGLWGSGLFGPYRL